MKSTTLQEQEQSQMNVEEQAKWHSISNQSLIYRERIPYTPFWIIGNNETEEYALAIANAALSEKFKSPQEVQDWLKLNQWEVIQKLIIYMNQVIKQDDEITKGLKQKHENEQKILSGIPLG